VIRLLLLLLAMVLASCAGPSATLPAAVRMDSLSVRQGDLAKLSAWTIKGRLAIQTEQEGWTVTLHWVQDKEHYTLRFIAPLGQGTYELNGDVNTVSLLTADNQFLQADNPEKLMLDNLGWNVPLNGLKYWVRGLPEPDTIPDNLEVDDRGRITDLRQSGWNISILRYVSVAGIDLPDKLFMQNDRFKLRLVIQDWKTAT
jgi:outer membrane lipoprotein LolB